MAERTSVLHPYAAAITSALFGVAVAAYLSVEYLTGQAGLCLTGSGCDAVRASAFAYPFAYPFGVPLPRLGVAFFLTAGWLVWRSRGAKPAGGSQSSGTGPMTIPLPCARSACRPEFIPPIPPRPPLPSSRELFRARAPAARRW